MLDLRGPYSASRPDQLSPPSRPGPHPQPAGRAEHQPVSLAQGALPRLGAAGRRRTRAPRCWSAAPSWRCRAARRCSTTPMCFKNGCRVDDQIAAAAELGIRFVVSRGSMSLGQSKGGLPPDDCVEDEDAILKDCVRVIERYHDAAPGSMLQIVLAPCSPFSVTADLMRESAKMARHYGVHLHTHLCETLDEERYTLQHHGAAAGRLHGIAGLGGQGRLVRARGARRRRRDPPVRGQGRRRLPLPVVEHAARVGHRAGEEISRRRRADRARGRRLGEQRRVEPAGRGARGDAAGAAEDRPAAARRAARRCCRPPTRCGPRSG